jgi:simple sugar transport system ATP-binding protein/ribose transport system ATP-binding protein
VTAPATPARRAGGDGPLLEAVGITKTFGATAALRGVSVAVYAGRVHGLIGENGAGKSTLSKIIAGVTSLDSGTLLLRGRPLRLSSPRHALRQGIAYIGQERNLVPARSVIENVMLGIESCALGVVVSRRALARQYRELTEATGMHLPPDRAVARLRAPEQQQVEILRALARGAELLVMDEPTAALGHEEVQSVMATVASLRDQGRAVVYVSHAIEEVTQACDEITIMRDGQVIETGPAASQTRDSLVAAMIGEEPAAPAPGRPVPQHAGQPPSSGRPRGRDAVLVAAGLSQRGALSDVSLTVSRGEVVALTGLIGSGASDVARALAGADRTAAGRVEITTAAGRRAVRRPSASWRQGIAFIPESRAAQGILPERSVAENIVLPSLRKVSRLGIVSRRRERAMTAELIRQLGIRCSGPRARMRTLSGGNQQKVLFARALFAEPVVVVAIEPTLGVDVAARRAIHAAMAGLAESGIPVALATTDTEEALDLRARVLVMRNGSVAASFPAGAATKESILAAAIGSSGAEP